MEAGINEDGQLTIWSPRGFEIGIDFARGLVGTGPEGEKSYNLNSIWNGSGWTGRSFYVDLTSNEKTAKFNFDLSFINTPNDLVTAIATKLGTGYQVSWDSSSITLTIKKDDGTALDVNVGASCTSELLGDGIQASTYYRGGYKLDEPAATRTSPGIHGQNATIRSGANTTRQNAFGMLDDVIAAVKSGNRDALVEKMLPRVDAFINNILGVMSTNGALVNRYDANMARQTNEALIMTDEYDKLVKPDYSEVTSQLMLANYVYQANLAVISRLIQPSLLDFLS